MLAASLSWFATQKIAPFRVAATSLDDLRIALLTPPANVHEEVSIVSITEETLSAYPYRSPVNRRLLASILSELAGRNVRAVGMDVLFDQATIPEDDELLRKAISDFPEPLVFVTGSAENGFTPSQLAWQDEFLQGQRTGNGSLMVTDGVVRYLNPGRMTPEGFEPGFVTELARSVGIEPPTEPILLDYLVGTGGENATTRIFKVPAHRLATTTANFLFENRVVLIGFDMPNEDRFQTTLSRFGNGATRMPGVMIHAHALAQLIDGRELPVAGRGAEIALIIAATLAGFAIPLPRLNLIIKLLGGVAIFGGYWLFSFQHFADGGSLLPLASPSLAFLLAMGASTAYGEYQARSDQRFLRSAFGHYVSPAVIESILRNPERLNLGGEQRTMSYVFTDLEGFTSLSEKLEPDGVVGLLQDYFEGLLAIALARDGTVDRLVGDGVNIIFNAPSDQPDHARRAVECALEIDRYCQDFRRAKHSAGLPIGATRIGVNSGIGIVGNVGSADRFQYTAHGDSVNTAARLESVNKRLGTRVCISAESAGACPHLTFMSIGNIVVRGKSRGVDCVTLPEGLTEAGLRDYEAVFEHMRLLDPNCLEEMQQLQKDFPECPIIAFHCQRLSRGDTGTTIPLE